MKQNSPANAIEKRSTTWALIAQVPVVVFISRYNGNAHLRQQFSDAREKVIMALFHFDFFLDDHCGNICTKKEEIVKEEQRLFL